LPNKGPLKYRELIRRLKQYGIVEIKERGKGSERILLKPIISGSKKGPQFPIKHHGDNTEIYLPVIDAILRRFGIGKDFWN
jgi:hypothetical protein